MQDRKYYEAYDDRYCQVHGENLRWSSDMPSRIVGEVISGFSVPSNGKILEIGCGEGRDAKHLLHRGFNVLATDISSEAIAFCRRNDAAFSSCYQVLNCIEDRLEIKFDFIYAVAVIHMLVLDDDRAGFYHFVHDQLAENGIALICTMGDGRMESSSDIKTAFELQERHHQHTGRNLLLAGTSCRVVSLDTFLEELDGNGLAVCKHGFTSVEPDFPQMMYAVVMRKG